LCGNGFARVSNHENAGALIGGEGGRFCCAALHALRDKSSFRRVPLPANPLPCYRASRRKKTFEETVRQKAVTPGTGRKLNEAPRQGFHQDAIFQDAIL
jgi:hypothetical protein